jgi:hypothetical protein
LRFRAKPGLLSDSTARSFGLVPARLAHYHQR